MNNAWVREIRQAVRRLVRQPGFAVIGILTLGLGIGANAVLFTIVDQVVLRKLPVERPDELVILDTSGPTTGRWSQASSFSTQPFSYPMYLDFRDRSGVLQGVAGRSPIGISLAFDGTTEQVSAELVTGNYFEVLGVRPAAGRLFTQDDDRTKLGHPVVVLSHGAWQRRFGGRPEVVGRDVVVNGRSMQVIGVAAADFRSVQVGVAPEVFVPMAMKPVATPGWDDLDRRRSVWLDVFGRLAPGKTLEESQAALQVFYRQVLEQEVKEITNASASFAERFVAKKLDLRPGARGRSDYRGSFSNILFALTGMVGVVLLIACANLANLLATRATARQREMAVRVALGAGSGALVRPLFLESLLVALAGGALGLLLAGAGLPLVVRVLGGESLERVLSLGVEPRMLAFAVAIAVGTALLFGILPARSAARPQLASRLREDAAASTASRGQLRWRRVLVAGQVALSALVLVGACLFTRSLWRLLAVDPGLRTENVLTFSLDPRLNGYEVEASHQALTRIQAELGRLPGVTHVAMAETALLTGNASSSSIAVDGYQAAEDENMNPRFNLVTPGYFEALGISILRGRGIEDRDRKGAPPVAVINQKMAEYFFKDQDPIGRRFKVGRDEEWIEIVGVARDTAWRDLREERTRNVFLPLDQVYDGFAVTYYLRTAGAPEERIADVRRVVREVDQQLPLVDLQTLQTQVDRSLGEERMARTVSIAFGVLATLLAALGLYGVLAYSVAQRTREMGVRMALGAERSSLLRMVLADGLRPVVAGLAAGLLLAVPLAMLLRSLLYEAPAADVPAFLAVPPVLLAAAIVACLVPALRAAAIPPVRALRYE